MDQLVMADLVITTAQLFSCLLNIRCCAMLLIGDPKLEELDRCHIAKCPLQSSIELGFAF